jgi:hypothetical protein
MFEKLVSSVEAGISKHANRKNTKVNSTEMSLRKIYLIPKSLLLEPILTLFYPDALISA